MRTRSTLAIVLAAGVLAGCAGVDSAARPTAAPAAQVLEAPEPPQKGPSTALDGVELEVTGVHVLEPPPGDPGVARAAQALGGTVREVRQMHLLLALRSTGTTGHRVAGDRLRLRLGGTTLDAATQDVFPLETLAPGTQADTAVGFDVAMRPGLGPVVLLWTHAGHTVELPIGSARVAT